MPLPQRLALRGAVRVVKQRRRRAARGQHSPKCRLREFHQFGGGIGPRRDCRQSDWGADARPSCQPPAVVSTRSGGVAGDAETSVGEVGAAWSPSGPGVWVSWDGNPEEIETVAYRDPRRDQTVVRRATFAERVAGALQWNTIRIVLAIVILSAMGEFDFSPLDFDPLDFDTPDA